MIATRVPLGVSIRAQSGSASGSAGGLAQPAMISAKRSTPGFRAPLGDGRPVRLVRSATDSGSRWPVGRSPDPDPDTSIGPSA
ncbi:hypothetical protein GCM10025787_60640 [Saccharopolyspora rosea]